MTEVPPIKLKMTGKLSYDDDITVGQAAQIVAFLHSGQTPSTGASGDAADLIGRGSTRRPPASSPRDALQSSGAKTNPQKIVAFALYVEQQGDNETFTVDDIRPLFRQARESTPANLSRDLDAAIRLNWVAESDVKGEYYVKDQVRNILDAGFESVRAPRGGTKPKGAAARRPRTSRISTPQVFKDIEITTAIEGYINYHQVKTKTDRYLWALNAANLWGVDTLTNAELVWLTDKLGAGISAGEMGGNYRANLKRGYVNKNIQDKARIVPAGTDHLLSLKAGSAE